MHYKVYFLVSRLWVCERYDIGLNRGNEFVPNRDKQSSIEAKGAGPPSGKGSNKTGEWAVKSNRMRGFN